MTNGKSRTNPSYSRVISAFISVTPLPPCSPPSPTSRLCQHSQSMKAGGGRRVYRTVGLLRDLERPPVERLRLLELALCTNTAPAELKTQDT